ncbi:MAG: hypothetical protein FWD76_03465 [Firmicutes bacterium]|nr:hypothetical protein [Bacillota bacterium]
MILKHFVKGIAALINGIARAIASLLVVFWLWIPAVWCVGFYVICFLMGYDMVKYANVFYIGLAVSGAVSILCVSKKGLGKKIPLKAPETPAPNGFAGYHNVPPPSIYNVNQMYPPPSQQPLMPSGFGQQPFVGMGAPVPNMPYGAPVQGVVPPAQAYASNEPSGGNVYGQESVSPPSLQPSQAPYGPSPAVQEEIQYPLIFASRQYPNVIIREFVDRLEYYGRDGRQLYSLGVQFKEGSEAA